MHLVAAKKTDLGKVRKVAIFAYFIEQSLYNKKIQTILLFAAINKLKYRNSWDYKLKKLIWMTKIEKSVKKFFIVDILQSTKKISEILI